MRQQPKTLADYLVVAISPVLIMLLVGSLAFFLIQVFYRGELVHGIHWLMFWFVLAIVLVARIGIEQGRGHAHLYGVALAIVTWFYLGHTHKTFIAGAVLLAITWWCAHWLTVDCTLIREDEDASGEGVLQGLWRRVEISMAPPLSPLKPPLSPQDALIAAELSKRRPKKPPRPPGRSIVYFSLAALPLFGIGQLFLPTDDPHARRLGFAYLAVYMSAALGLLAATSFLGLRRYLRQRSVGMPTGVAFAWLKFGVLLGSSVLLLALILPRPGVHATWKSLAYRIEQKQHQASDYALTFNPPGEGEGAPTEFPAEQPVSGSSRPSTGSGSRRTSNENQARHGSRSDNDLPSESIGGNRGNGNQASSQGESGVGNAVSENDGNSKSQRTIELKDSLPSGGDGESNDGRPPDGRDRLSREGNGNPVNIKPSQARARNDSKLADEKKGKASLERDTSVDQPDRQQPENLGSHSPDNLFQKLIRAILIFILLALFVGAAIRYRRVLAEMVQSFFKAVRDFLQKLFNMRWRRKTKAGVKDVPPSVPPLHPFGNYENPFLNGKDKAWPPERLFRYTYEAVQAFAKEQGVEIPPQRTPREFCFELIERFPDLGPELERLSCYYYHVAFAKRLPESFETDSMRRLWRYLGDSTMVIETR